MTSTPTNLRPLLIPRNRGGGGGYIQKKMGRGVRKASWNPYPISDQNLWFSLPYFRPDQKGNVYTLLSTVHIPNSRLLSTVHIPNSRLECTNHTLFQTKMVKIDTLFRTKTGKKTMPFRAAHTYIAYITEYITPPNPPSPGLITNSSEGSSTCPVLQILTLFKTRKLIFSTPVLRPGVGRNYVVIT